ncbi:hypothetical protein MIZ01_0069 [Sideroxyarcus emersonii]|uniref:Uncharacterized protein n=1 Tax=Sideroxyarcus emersonii TaxID=2764705 RepID=A0AAN1X758_9PROT|nr:hypothetical protein [Sideroxyarcus emersonii]BCK86315.1 hypothetical protein MIZ01_0069 [Sideroxyarcus emersonii]
MFALPSIWNLFISTVVFFLAAWYIRRYLEAHGTPGGMTRGLLVFVLASLLSWGAGAAVDWVQEQIAGPQAAAQTPDDLSQLLKAMGQTRP